MCAADKIAQNLCGVRRLWQPQHFIPDQGQVRGGPDQKPGHFKEGAVTSLLLEASSWLRSQSLVAGVEVLEGNSKSNPAGATHLKCLGSPALNTGSLAPNNPLG